MWNLESLAAHIARQFYSNMFEEGEPHSSPVEFSNFSPGFGPVFFIHHSRLHIERTVARPFVPPIQRVFPVRSGEVCKPPFPTLLRR